jgi:hypothetical protein
MIKIKTFLCIAMVTSIFSCRPYDESPSYVNSLNSDDSKHDRKAEKSGSIKTDSLATTNSGNGLVEDGDPLFPPRK